MADTEATQDGSVATIDAAAALGGSAKARSADDVKADESLLSSMGLEAEEIERRKSNYNAAFEWLEMRAGNAACRAVAHCAVHERIGFTPTHLKSGLDALVEHFFLTGRGKSGHVRNRS